MVYGYRIIGREYYSEWRFESLGEAKEELGNVIDAFFENKRDKVLIEVYERNEDERIIGRYILDYNHNRTNARQN